MKLRKNLGWLLVTFVIILNQLISFISANGLEAIEKKYKKDKSGYTKVGNTFMPGTEGKLLEPIVMSWQDPDYTYDVGTTIPAKAVKVNDIITFQSNCPLLLTCANDLSLEINAEVIKSPSYTGGTNIIWETPVRDLLSNPPTITFKGKVVAVDPVAPNYIARINYLFNGIILFETKVYGSKEATKHAALDYAKKVGIPASEVTLSLNDDDKSFYYIVFRAPNMSLLVERIERAINVQKPGPIPVDSVSLEDKTLLVNQTDVLIPKILPTNADDKSLTWSSDDSSIVTVDNMGKITGIKKGVTRIHAITNGPTSSNTPIDAVSRVIIVQPTVKLDKEKVLILYNTITKTSSLSELTATVSPSIASGQDVRWSYNVIKGINDNDRYTDILNIQPDPTNNHKIRLSAKSAGIVEVLVTTIDGNSSDKCIVEITPTDVN